MPAEILELLTRLREPGDNPLTDDEIGTLLTALRAHADELRDAERTDETVSTLREIATAVDEVRTEQGTRAEAAAERDRQAEEALARIADPEPEGTEPAAEAAQPDGEQPAEGEDAAPAAEAAREPVAAGGAPTGARPPLGTVRPPARHTPRPTPAAGVRIAGSLVAAGDVPGFSAGDEIPSWDALADAMSRKLRSMGPRGGSVLVASVRTEYPEDRRLGASAEDNERKIRAVTAPEALIATGGVCSPVSVDYSVPVFSTTERPVRDTALARFGADRGGITFTPPPALTVASTGVGVWTNANDINPTSPTTKALYTVSCGTPTTVLVDAITTRLKIGNMAGRFSPEWVAANTEQALAFAARTAEVNLLGKIKAASLDVTLTPSVGATRGILEMVDQALAAFRYRQRVSDQMRFRIILERWVKDMIRADLAKEIAHDSSGRDSLAVTDAQIDAFFAVRNINVTWALDGVAADATTGEVYAAQQFAAQTTDTALNAWPAQVVFPLYREGGFQFLDGGELNLGVVRDSTLDGTNDYETFVETFENVAFRGNESLWCIATVAPTGASAGTVTPANP